MGNFRRYFTFGLMFLMIVSMGCTESSIEKGSASTDIGEVTTAAPTTKQALETTAPPKEEVPSQLDLEVGEAVVVKSLGDAQQTEITVKSTELKKFYTNEFTGPEFAKEGTEYYFFDVNIKNLGMEEVYFFVDNFFMTDEEGNKYNPEYTSTDDKLISDNLFPNMKLGGTVAFLLPETVRAPKLGYNFANLFESGTKLVFWTFDQEASRLVEEVSGEVSISDVEGSWTQYGSFGSGSIGTISYAIKNTGNTPIVPLVDLEIKRGSATIKQEKDIMDNEKYSMYTVDVGATEKYEEFQYESVEQEGNYDVKLTVTDYRTGETIGTATKLVTLS